jgi:hypothetical protein
MSETGRVRPGAIVGSVVAALVVAAWAAGASTPLPPTCSAADAQRGGILVSAGWGTDDQPGYARYCGPARAVVRVGGKSFTFKGGHCTSQRARFGVLWNGIGTAPPGRGFWVLLQGGRRAGRNEISDGELQLNGRVLVPKGTAIVAKSLKSATFSLATRGASPTKVTGSWTCG